ncbi:phosphatase PAP2 family protein [Cohnella panacarvi]|uniref:phosphatase PAP2 family protein n=1 Tax=Cohnella panacarvi TaxID=400776 RepID=UPI000478DFBD|nr:phosphatase PAP2 family protein [Cohnella panacarvi]
MRRIYHLLQQAERPLFLHVNIRWHRSALNGLFLALSIIGGAVFSLTFSLLSRIYFGLHYPSDTLAGAMLGSSTAMLVGLWI